MPPSKDSHVHVDISSRTHGAGSKRSDGTTRDSLISKKKHKEFSMRTKIRGKKMYQEKPQIESEPCQIKAVWKPNF